jgi:hypothetical protein
MFAAVCETLHRRNILVLVIRNNVLVFGLLEYSLIIEENGINSCSSIACEKKNFKQGEFNSEIVGPGSLGL